MTASQAFSGLCCVAAWEVHRGVSLPSVAARRGPRAKASPQIHHGFVETPFVSVRSVVATTNCATEILSDNCAGTNLPSTGESGSQGASGSPGFQDSEAPFLESEEKFQSFIYLNSKYIARSFCESCPPICVDPLKHDCGFGSLVL